MYYFLQQERKEMLKEIDPSMCVSGPSSMRWSTLCVSMLLQSASRVTGKTLCFGMCHTNHMVDTRTHPQHDFLQLNSRSCDKVHLSPPIFSILDKGQWSPSFSLLAELADWKNWGVAHKCYILQEDEECTEGEMNLSSTRQNTTFLLEKDLSSLLHLITYFWWFSKICKPLFLVALVSSQHLSDLLCSPCVAFRSNSHASSSGVHSRWNLW